ncbi:ribosome biogenesis GTP-binding protein YihA/YsxC [Fodinicurvata fenggangensis]|uniref:ribosome biogenesis GTP-binding protein YihA/YsxC n=1 Tax=Fodinicurvata fenggangensis TaxID=1121830 RepID=UPI0005585D66|nr:ribosome biogenesis GTP-binding protein YihA/YsxC [Fodinicurvata fenggangensis]
MDSRDPDAEETGSEGPDQAWLEEGRLLFSAECRFLLSVADAEQVPASDLPEVAFAGRSNVGKSSLVNALTGRKTLARTSNTPGRTQQLNFFDLGGRLMLSDLPGYGYAKAPKADVARWTRLTRAYLKGRPQLRRILLLVDSRHGLKTADREIMKELDKAAVSYQAVLTKTDKIKQEALAQVIVSMAGELKTHPAAHPDVMVTSSQAGLGIPELRAELATVALPRQAG